jgi:hypothetical protein
MRKGASYIVHTSAGINAMTVLFLTTDAVKVRWRNGITEWIWLSEFQSPFDFIDPKKKILETISPFSPFFLKLEPSKV